MTRRPPRKPIPDTVAPADLASALHDRIAPTSGRLLRATPIQSCPHCRRATSTKKGKRYCASCSLWIEDGATEPNVTRYHGTIVDST